MDCGDFTATYIIKSSDNTLAFFKTRGLPDKMTANVAACKFRLVISKLGSQWTISRVLINVIKHTIKFELDKEFDEIKPDGHVSRCIMLAGNGGKQLIQKIFAEREVKVIYDFNDSEAVMTATVDGVTGKWFLVKD
ncbi:fatty acid-binding protein-like [Oppia nitens]|uniref:fatty acid-binding protein-like n=1 Tax=Oppia nitens TaxID=1686743 RepID=UPI0023DA1DE4|nr:fatty acid-binding protein-like [Oppia nitens]